MIDELLARNHEHCQAVDLAVRPAFWQENNMETITLLMCSIALIYAVIHTVVRQNQRKIDFDNSNLLSQPWTGGSVLAAAVVLMLTFAQAGHCSNQSDRTDRYCRVAVQQMEELRSRIEQVERFARSKGLKSLSAESYLRQATDHLRQARFAIARRACVVAVQNSRMGMQRADAARIQYMLEDAKRPPAHPQPRSCKVTVMRQVCRRLPTIPPYYVSPSQICWWESQQAEGTWNADKRCCEVVVDGHKQCVEDGAVIWGLPISWW